MEKQLEYLLAVETSCDETAAAVVDSNLDILSNVVVSQNDLHQRFGGVVPEIASREHVRKIVPAIDSALRKAGVSYKQLSAIAVTAQPGLAGSLIVGLTAAKTIACAKNIPLIAVNHLEAHIYACRMAAGRDVFPAIGFVVSGGHTNLYDCPNATDYRLIGSTLDDAAGEAFDKVAHILGLPYPGGPEISQIAQNGNADKYQFPRTFLKEDRLAFSFSGIKTAVLYEVQGQPGSSKIPQKMTTQRRADIAASFQQAVVDVLIAKCRQAIGKYGYRTLCVGGGVAANVLFRTTLEKMADDFDVNLFIAPMELCTDNAAMAGIAWEYYKNGEFSELDVDIKAGMVRH